MPRFATSAPGSALCLALLSLLLFPSAGRADVVGPPPATCPTGAHPTTCHVLNGYCAPTTCTSDASCGAGEHCASTSLCISAATCYGRVPTTVETVTGGDCGSDCPGGGACATRMLCVPASTTPDLGAPGGPTHSMYGCCSAAGTRGAAGGALVMLALAALARLRRRP